MLIKSYQERMQRAIDKKRLILRFLRDETWTTVKNIQLLLAVHHAAAYQTLAQLKRDGFVKSASYRGLGGQFTLWGITAHGLLLSYEEDEKVEDRPHFDPSKVTLSTLDHTLAIQVARIKAEQHGWQAWQNGRHLHQIHPNKRPDAIAINPQGQKVAIEIERTIKTKKRYEVIISTYLQAMAKREYDGVAYLCPTLIATRLAQFFRLISSVPVRGERVKLEEKHYQKFKFYDLAVWPPD